MTAGHLAVALRRTYGGRRSTTARRGARRLGASRVGFLAVGTTSALVVRGRR